ncbi:MAG: glycosyltransferase [Candidatus Cloacimonadaceae bacterium]
MRDKIHVLYIRNNLSDDYSPYMAASMLSVIDNCSISVIFHIIYDDRISVRSKDQTLVNMKKLQDLLIRPDDTICYHVFHLPDNMNNIFSYSRLYIPELLPDVDMVVLLGGDTIVKTDLGKLIACIPKNYSISGGLEPGIAGRVPSKRSIHKFYEKTGMDTDKYICPDLCIYNLEKIRENKTLPDKALRFFKEHPDVPLYEQDILNWVFMGDKYILPQRFYLPLGLSEEEVKKILAEQEIDGKPHGYILHFAGAIKPWDQYHSKYDREFWHYFFQTPWGKEEELIKFLQQKRTLDNIILNMNNTLWGHPLKRKLWALWQLSFPLYYKLFLRYIKSKGH